MGTVYNVAVVHTVGDETVALAETVGENGDELQDALLSVDPASVTVRLDGVDAAIEDVPVGVTKVPHLGEQNDAELSVKPEGHAHFHPHF